MEVTPCRYSGTSCPHVGRGRDSGSLSGLTPCPPVFQSASLRTPSSRPCLETSEQLLPPRRFQGCASVERIHPAKLPRRPEPATENAVRFLEWRLLRRLDGPLVRSNKAISWDGGGRGQIVELWHLLTGAKQRLQPMGRKNAELFFCLSDQQGGTEAPGRTPKETHTPTHTHSHTHTHTRSMSTRMSS